MFHGDSEINGFPIREKFTAELLRFRIIFQSYFLYFFYVIPTLLNHVCRRVPFFSLARHRPPGSCDISIYRFSKSIDHRLSSLAVRDKSIMYVRHRGPWGPHVTFNLESLRVAAPSHMRTCPLINFLLFRPPTPCSLLYPPGDMLHRVYVSYIYIHTHIAMRAPPVILQTIIRLVGIIVLYYCRFLLIPLYSTMTYSGTYPSAAVPRRIAYVRLPSIFPLNFLHRESRTQLLRIRRGSDASEKCCFHSARISRVSPSEIHYFLSSIRNAPWSSLSFFGDAGRDTRKTTLHR